MSDSLNSPDLSSEYHQELTPETDVPAVNEQSVMASSHLDSAVEDFESSLDDLGAIASSKELSPEEEASFEVIADYIEAEIAIEEAVATGAAERIDRESDESQVASEDVELSGGEAIASKTADEAADSVEISETGALAGDAEILPEEEILLEDTAEEALPGEALIQQGVTEEGMIQADMPQIDMPQAGVTEAGASEQAAESFDASIEVVDVEILESQEQEQSYEVYQDGTLTYFQYFLDDEDSAFGPGYGEWRNEASSSPRSFVSATAVGVGALAAVFGAGLLMAEATNQNSISDSDGDSFETQAKAETERKASDSAGLAKASSPETTTPDWSATQKALAVSEGSANANPALGSAAEKLQRNASPATSSATGKLAPLAQAWGAPIPLPPPLSVTPLPAAASPVASLPIAPPPAVATASLPTPTTVPANLSALKPIPSYQVVQPTSSNGDATARLPAPPTIEAWQPDGQQLQARMEALRDRMSEPIDAGSVPVATDGSLLDGPDERWVGNVPNRVNVPINRPSGESGGTTINSAFAPQDLPTLTDSPYRAQPPHGVETRVTSSPAAMPSGPAPAASEAASDSIATAPQAYPLDLNPVVPPAQAPSLDAKIVAPVAGLVPTPAAPVETEPGELPPQASAAPVQNSESATQVKAARRGLDRAAQTASTEASSSSPSAEQTALEVAPGAIALEVIPPKVSTLSLTAAPPTASPARESTLEVQTLSVSGSEQQPVRFQTVSSRPSPSQSANQNVNSLLELANRQSVHPLALSRDTALAVLENAERLDQFRVLPLTVQEYQRLWQESGTGETYAPVHGFVDYGQNVIAVLVARAANRNAAALQLEMTSDATDHSSEAAVQNAEQGTV